MTDPDDFRAALEHAASKLRQYDLALTYTITGNVLNLTTTLDRDRASAAMFDTVDPIRAPRGMRFTWLGEAT